MRLSRVRKYYTILLQMKFWRCPKCDALLPVKHGFYTIKYCHECGEELDFNRW